MRPVVSFTALRHPVARLSLRSRPLPSTRNTTSNAAQTKVQDTLGSLRRNVEKQWETAKLYLGPMSENVLGAYRQPLVYNLSVAREILKQIYIAEGLQPPTSLATIRSAYATLWTRVSNPAYWRQIANGPDLARVAIYAVEAYGIFKIGEIIGRRSLVGYNLH